MFDDEETLNCDFCGALTTHTVTEQTSPDDWETWAMCEACEEESRAMVGTNEIDFLSDEELEAIMREEEALVAADQAFEERFGDGF